MLYSAPEDYEAVASSIITFGPTQISAIVSVTIVDDDVLEDVEQFTVEVVATGGQERVDVGDAANISISNDDCKAASTVAHSIGTPGLLMCLFSCEDWILIRCV